MMLSSELLPAPFGPISEQISPRPTEKLSAARALTPRNESETSLNVEYRLSHRAAPRGAA